MAATYKITVGTGTNRSWGKTIEVTWEELKDALDDQGIGPKGRDWWSPITWRNGKRASANFESASLIVLDVDKWDGTNIHSYGVSALQVNSYSSTSEEPRYRLILPLTTPVTNLEEYRRLLEHWIHRAGGDSSGSDGARYFFYGTCREDTYRFCDDVNGDAAPVDPGHHMEAPSSLVPHEAWGDVDPTLVCTCDITEADIKAVLARSPEAVWPTTREHMSDPPMVEGRHDHGVRLIGELCRMFPTASKESLRELLLDWASDWPDQEDPKFWSHLERCFDEPRRLREAADIHDQAVLGETIATQMGGGPADPTIMDLEAELPPVPWISRPLHLSPGRPTIVSGKGSSMKTSALMDMAVSLSRGEDIWSIEGSAPPRPQRVLWCDYEMGRNAVLRKFQKLYRAGKKPLEPIRLLDDPPDMGTLDGSEDQFAALLGQLTGLIDVVIVDNLSAATPIDENARDIRKPLDALRRAVGESMMCVVVHHARKSDAQDKRDAMSGHAAIYNAAGAVFLFERSLDSEPGRVTVRLTKSHAEHDSGASVPFAFELAGQSSGAFMFEEAAPLPDAEEERRREKARAEAAFHIDIQEALRTGCRSEAEVQARIPDRTIDEIRKVLLSMEKAGLVVNNKMGGRNVWISRES